MASTLDIIVYAHGPVTCLHLSGMLDGENPVKVWGDGSAVRDFIFSEEVAHWMMVAMEKAPPCTPINLGSGTGHTIKQIAETIAGCMPITPEIEWDTSKASGDPVRLMNMDRAKEPRILPLTPLEDGLRKPSNGIWTIKNWPTTDRRYSL